MRRHRLARALLAISGRRCRRRVPAPSCVPATQRLLDRIDAARGGRARRPGPCVVLVAVDHLHDLGRRARLLAGIGLQDLGDLVARRPANTTPPASRPGGRAGDRWAGTARPARSPGAAPAWRPRLLSTSACWPCGRRHHPQRVAPAEHVEVHVQRRLGRRRRRRRPWNRAGRLPPGPRTRSRRGGAAAAALRSARPARARSRCRMRCRWRPCRRRRGRNARRSAAAAHPSGPPTSASRFSPALAARLERRLAARRCRAHPAAAAIAPRRPALSPASAIARTSRQPVRGGRLAPARTGCVACAQRAGGAQARACERTRRQGSGASERGSRRIGGVLPSRSRAVCPECAGAMGHGPAGRPMQAASSLGSTAITHGG